MNSDIKINHIAQYAEGDINNTEKHDCLYCHSCQKQLPNIDTFQNYTYCNPCIIKSQEYYLDLHLEKLDKRFLESRPYSMLGAMLIFYLAMRLPFNEGGAVLTSLIISIISFFVFHKSFLEFYKRKHQAYAVKISHEYPIHKLR